MTDKMSSKITMTLECHMCHFETQNYNKEWKQHLLSQEHQSNARSGIKMETLDDKKKSAIIFGLMGVKTKEVLKYFGDFALITNFIYWKERPDFCIIKFLTPGFRNQVVSGSHQISNIQLFLRPRNKISEVEWISICPYAITAPAKVKQEKNSSEDDELKISSSDDEENEDECQIINMDITTPNDVPIIKEIDDAVEEMRLSNSIRKNSSFSNALTSSLKNGGSNDNEAIGIGNCVPSLSSDQDQSEAVSAPDPISCMLVAGKAEGISLDILNPVTQSPGNSSALSNSNNSMIGDGNHLKQSTSSSLSSVDNFSVTLPDNRYRSESVSYKSARSLDLNDSDFETTCSNFEEPSQVISVDNPSAATLNDIMENFYNQNLMPPKDWNFRIRAREKLIISIRKRYPQCILIPYGVGSTAISSGRETLHMYADLLGTSGAQTNKDISLKSKQIEEFSTSLIRILNSADCVEYISHVSLSDHYNAIDFTFCDMIHNYQLLCKIQVTDFFPAQKCRLVNFMCTLDDRVRPLLIIMRHWAYHHNLVKSNPGSNSVEECFHPAAMQWFAVYFLIYKEILPTVQVLRLHSRRAPIYHRGINIAFCSDPNTFNWTKKTDYEINPDSRNPSAKCMLTLAQEMFQYFGTCKFGTMILSPLIGNSMRKRDLTKPSNKIFDSKDWCQTIRIPLTRPISLQDPLKLSINLTFEVSGRVSKLFKQECLNTASLLGDCLKNGAVGIDPIDLIVIKSCHNVISTPIRVPPPVIASPVISTPAPVAPVINPSPLFPSSASKKRDNIKIKNLVLKFSMKKYIENQMQTRPNINLPHFWFECFKEFNKKVWPLCFGVQLQELNSEEAEEVPIPPGLTNEWKKLEDPIFGVITNPEKLKWAFKTSKAATKENKLRFLEFQSLLNAQSRQNEAKGIIYYVKNCSPDSSQRKTFSFQCQTFSHITKNSSAEIEVHFRKIICNPSTSTAGKDSHKVFKATFFKMYTDLCKDYFIKNINKYY